MSDPQVQAIILLFFSNDFLQNALTSITCMHDCWWTFYIIIVANRKVNMQVFVDISLELSNIETKRHYSLFTGLVLSAMYS